MSKGAIIAVILSVIVVLGGFVGYRMYALGKVSDDARALATRYVDQHEIYEEAGVWVESEIDVVHGSAFRGALISQGLVKQPDFDENVYIKAVLEHLADASSVAGRTEAAELFRKEASKVKPAI
ncbi:MAG: hypothetical protein RIB32_02530 [Phycisphaerales bacterium]